MRACVFSRLAFVFLLVIYGGGCATSDRDTGTWVDNSAIPLWTGIPTTQPSITEPVTSTQKPSPSVIGIATSTAIASEAPPAARTVTADSEKPRLVATPVALDQLAAATLTAAAPGLTSTIPTPDQAAPVVSPSPSATATSPLHYVFPIQPPEIADYSAGHHGYPATDLFAPYRSRYVAVTDGTIDELSRIDRWDPATNDPALRGGLYVSLIGADGVRYYGSHLDEVAPGLEAGTYVTAGMLLGYVGSSGNARGIAPHVHFGISPPTLPGDWQIRRGTVGPFEYLKAWARGGNLTPTLP